MGNEKRALIISGAPAHDGFCLKEFANAQLIICADGGLRYAQQAQIEPHLFVGDCDSCDAIDGDFEKMILPAEKDDTDTMYALRIAIERGYQKTCIVCATGGRIDHFLANLSLCEFAYFHQCRCTIYDEKNKIFFLPQGITQIQQELKYRYFSIIPLDEMLENVTIQGAKYLLDNATLHRRAMISVSNEFASEMISVEIGRGCALCVLSSD